MHTAAKSFVCMCKHVCNVCVSMHTCCAITSFRVHIPGVMLLLPSCPPARAKSHAHCKLRAPYASLSCWNTESGAPACDHLFKDRLSDCESVSLPVQSPFGFGGPCAQQTAVAIPTINPQWSCGLVVNGNFTCTQSEIPFKSESQLRCHSSTAAYALVSHYLGVASAICCV